MKKNIIRLILILSISISCLELMSQGTPPSPPSGGIGQGGNQEAGGDAPIGSGTAILITLSIAYGSKNFFLKFKDQNKTLNEFNWPYV
jgi:hypothetical protein